MNKLYTSNRNELLCEKLAENIKSQSGSLFSKTMIITQSGGMNAWLTTQLARHNGIFAHYEFANPDGFMGKVYELLFGERLLNNHDTIQYGLYDLLADEAFKSGFPEVACYYHDNELRRMQLAARVADLFDQYQLYRSDMIVHWEKGICDTGNDAEKWQQWLWYRMGIISKAAAKEKIIHALMENKEKIWERWPEIHLFGISIFTEFHLDFYKKLGEVINVHYYLNYPTLLEREFKHELMQSYGSKVLELKEFFRDMDIEWNHSPAFFESTQLGKLQNSIFSDENLDQTHYDRSIEVHSCHTPLREIEALYNYLLQLFESRRGEKGLNPMDVLVVMPDIVTYEPLIKAVFRNAPVKLPFKVTGVPGNGDDSMTAALEQILNLREDDCTAEKLMGLVEQSRVKRRLQIRDIAYLRATLIKSGIRFGLENRIEDHTQYVSWKYGLEKILLGYAMHTDEEFEDKYPYPDAEASASYDLLRLKAFVDALEAFFDTQKQSLTLKQWAEFFKENVLLEMVFCDGSKKEDREERNTIYKAIQFINELKCDYEVPYNIFLHELNVRLFKDTSKTEMNSGRITFSPIIPARGIPYKVIAFIGLNNGAFPRKDHFLGFDLMADNTQVGDRSKTEADKYLFLDTLMAARENLYLSYLGQNPKDNKELPPSIVLDTLVDYLQLEKKVVKHPLHGFSHKYNTDAHPDLVSYLYNSKPRTLDTDSNVSKESATENGDIKGNEELKEVWVKSFTDFFEAPIDWYFKKILGVNYRGQDDDTIPETELFGLDNLQKWKVKNQLLHYNGKVEDFVMRGIKQGALPLKNIGMHEVNKLSDEIEPMKKTFQRLTANKESSEQLIDIMIDDIRIRGTIEGIYVNDLIRVTFSENKKYTIRAILTTLLLCTQKTIEKSILIDNTGKEFLLPVYNADEAVKRLSALIRFFKKGQKAPLIFTLNASEKVQDGSVLAEDVLKAIENEAFPNEFSSIPPNLYLRNLWDEGYFESLEEEHLEDLISLTQLLNA